MWKPRASFTLLVKPLLQVIGMQVVRVHRLDNRTMHSYPSRAKRPGSNDF